MQSSKVAYMLSEFNLFQTWDFFLESFFFRGGALRIAMSVSCWTEVTQEIGMDCHEIT